MARTKKATKAVTPPVKAGPPYELTPEQETAVLADYRFKGGEIDYEVDKAKGALDNIASEIEAIADRVSHEINDIDHDGRSGSRVRSEALWAFALALASLSARMMRAAGQLEAYADCVEHAGRPEDMVEAHRDGTLGSVTAQSVSREVMRRRAKTEEATVTP